METSSIEIVNSSPSVTFYCCVLGCNNNSENSPSTTFHSLPIMNQIKKSKNMNDEKSQFISKQLKICDQHFKQNNVLKVLNSDPSNNYSMSLVMPSINTKSSINQEDYQDESFILGPADIPLATGSTEEIVEEEVVTTELDDSDIKYSVFMQSENFVEVKSEEYYDLDNMCRVCLTQEGDLRNIETDYCDDILIFEMLQTCVNGNSPIEAKLPKHMCLSCLTDLKTMYDFVVRYKNTKSTLETYINKQQDINERRFYLEHGYINQAVNINEAVDASASTSGFIQESADPDEIKISNSLTSLSKELVNNACGKSNIELDGKTYVLAKVFLCKSCNELIFVKESLKEHKCDPKKKTQTIKQMKTNLVIKQTDINQCNHCGKKFSSLLTHICDATKKTGADYSNLPAQKCPKCKLIFKYFHKCEYETQQPQTKVQVHPQQLTGDKKMPLLIIKQSKKRKVSTTM